MVNDFESTEKNKFINELTISGAVKKFIRIVEQSRSVNTSLSYTKGLNLFCTVLSKSGLKIEENLANQITEDYLPAFLDELKKYSPATERLYAATVTRFLNFLMAEKLADINLPRVHEIIKMRTRRIGQRLPQFPRSDIEKILNTLLPLPVNSEPDNETSYLRDLRDRALLIALADTGLRIHEACNLRRGDIDWNEGHAIIIGKGDKQAVVRFSIRSMEALKVYLQARSKLDGNSGKLLSALPLFARHDKGAGKKIKGITPTTGRNIVEEKVREILGDDALGKITPHSFRHYFVTTVLHASGNLKLAQELARHSNISVTQRYAHISDDELDHGYHDIFNKE